MKRILSFAAMLVIALALATDIATVQAYLMNPDAFALIESVSFLHYLLLHVHGLEFAVMRALFSALLLICWGWKFIFPSEMEMLKYATLAFVLMWLLIDVMIVTGILGILQGVVGVPVDFLDFSVLVSAVKGQTVVVALYALLTFGAHLLLASIPALYNNCFKTDNVQEPVQG